MPRSCSICTSPDLSRIDAALSAGASLRNVAERFGTSKSAVERHRSEQHTAGSRLVKGSPDTPGDLSNGEAPAEAGQAAMLASGVMRPADGGYIYNLQIPSDATAIPGAKYTVKITVNGASEYVVLEIRK